MGNLFLLDALPLMYLHFDEDLGSFTSLELHSNDLEDDGSSFRDVDLEDDGSGELRVDEILFEARPLS